MKIDWPASYGDNNGIPKQNNQRKKLLKSVEVVMGAPQLDLVVLPHEFFRGKVVEALQNQKLSLREEVEFYLVNLLCEFVAPGKLQTVTGEIDALDTPLAIMLQQALDAPPQERIRIYKYLGDTSLYVSGFFQDYFNRKTFDISYYIALGSSAYNNVATLFKDHHGDQHFNSVFTDMSNRFHQLVDVVAEVSEVPGTAKPLDLLSVYDRWTRSNSDRLRKTLLRAGILPIQVPVKDKQ